MQRVRCLSEGACRGSDVRLLRDHSVGRYRTFLDGQGDGFAGEVRGGHPLGDFLNILGDHHPGNLGFLFNPHCCK